MEALGIVVFLAACSSEEYDTPPKPSHFLQHWNKVKHTPTVLQVSLRFEQVTVPGRSQRESLEQEDMVPGRNEV